MLFDDKLNLSYFTPSRSNRFFMALLKCMGLVLILSKVNDRLVSYLHDSPISFIIQNKPSEVMLLELRFIYRDYSLEIEAKLKMDL